MAKGSEIACNEFNLLQSLCYVPAPCKLKECEEFPLNKFALFFLFTAEHNTDTWKVCIESHAINEVGISWAQVNQATFRINLNGFEAK